MRTSTLVLGLLAALLQITTAQEDSKAHRDGKAFSLFSIVQFPNQQCTGASSTSTYGTCFTSSTYIRNPGYPSSYTASSASTCTYTFNKASDDICQLRLDFQTFSGFATSTTAGDCYDTLAMAGQTG